MQNYLLTSLTMIPLVGVFLLLLTPRESELRIRLTTLAVTLFEFLVSLVVLFEFQPQVAGFQLREYRPWVPQLGITYDVGVDGISIYLLLLTTFLTPLAVLSSWHSVKTRVRDFGIALLFLELAMVGSFIHLNLFFFFLFWETMLVPMALIIGIWGSGDRKKSALKFFLYTAFGSLLMLVAIMVLYYESYVQNGLFSFNYYELLRLKLTAKQELWLFLAFFLAFAIKIPLFPFHTWLPDAHSDAPTPGSVILAGILLKMGGYGLLRFAIPLFPTAAFTLAPFVIVLAVIGILYGALMAFVQSDIKRLVAYSSVSHMGFVVLGIFSQESRAGIGAVLQMLNHGLSTGALFMLVGALYDRRHTREIGEYGGLKAVTPWLSFVFIFVTMSSIGLPGLNGFIGEFLILVGSFARGVEMILIDKRYLLFISAIVAVFGVILGAVYMLTFVMRIFFGTITHQENRHLPDLSLREWGMFVPVLLLMIWIGVYPLPFLQAISPAVRFTVEERWGKVEPEMYKWQKLPSWLRPLPGERRPPR
jgi:NADH-quinone oxidoreductase subunit M